MREVCSLAAASQAPQFYISTKQALIRYYAFKQSGIIDVEELNQQQFSEIFRRFEQLMKKNKGLKPYKCMAQVLRQPAPSFYINPNSALFYYYRAIKNRNKKCYSYLS